jgi:hypothetical protein
MVARTKRHPGFNYQLKGKFLLWRMKWSANKAIIAEYYRSKVFLPFFIPVFFFQRPDTEA